MKIRIEIAIVVLLMIQNALLHGQVTMDPACAQSVESYAVTGYDDSEFIWSVENGQVIQGDGTMNVNIEWGYATGEFQFEVLEVTTQGCSNTPSIATITIRAPYVDIGAPDQAVCEGDSTFFDADAPYQSPYVFEWQDGSDQYRYVSNSTELVWVKVTDGFGCFRYDSVMHTVNPLPAVWLPKDTVLCDPTEPLRVDAGDYDFYEWTSSNGNSYSGNPVYIAPVVFNNDGSLLTDTVSVRVTDVNGCSNNDTILILPCDLNAIYKDMPNTISPNNDGYNDTWQIPFDYVFKDAVLEIFDRWGRLVYRTENVMEEPWDGTSNGNDLPMDSYYFVLELNFMNFEPIVGTVNLIR